jgi:cell division protein FtsB
MRTKILFLALCSAVFADEVDIQKLEKLDKENKALFAEVKVLVDELVAKEKREKSQSR